MGLFMKNTTKFFFLQLLVFISIYVNAFADAEPANDSCGIDAEFLDTIVSGTNTFSGTIESSSPGIDYYQMEIQYDGNITITWESSNPAKDASFLVGSSCDANDDYNGSTAANIHTTTSIDVTEDEVVYLKVYNGEDKAYSLTVEYDIDTISGPKLDVAIVDSDDPVQVGEYFYYIIDVSNVGTNESSKIELTSTLSSNEVLFDVNTTNNNSSFWSCDPQSGVTVTCSHDTNMPSGATHSLNLYVTAPLSAGTISNDVTVADTSSSDSATEETTITAEIPNAENFCYVEYTVDGGLNADLNASCEKIGNYYYGQNCTAQIIIVENNISAEAITNLTVTKMYESKLQGTDANASSDVGSVLNAGKKSTLTIADYPTFEEGYIVDLNESINNGGSFTITDTGSYDNQPLTDIGIYADYNISDTHHFGRVYSCDGSGEVSEFTTIEDVDFTLVHGYFYPHSDGNNYYNLPTQITSRADNLFKVIALDELNPGSLKDINGTVLLDVELVDGNTGTDCASREPLSDLIVDVSLINTNEANFVIDSTTIPDPDTPNPDRLFYEKAAKNAYFRVSYATDENGGLITFEETSSNSGKFHLPGFEDYAGQLCKNPFTDNKYNPDGTVQKQYDYKLVSVACANAGISTPSGMSQNEVDICIKCLFGGNSVSACSKDNFAIRPEAFMVTIKDQNQTNATSQSTLGENITATPLDLASGYAYNIETNATNHYSDTSSANYNTADNNISLVWNPAPSATACNDTSNKATPITFAAGSADLNITNAQVGEYLLNITDTTWTAVDKVIHAAANFYIDGTNITDCIDNSSDTQTIGSTTLNGCNTSTAHTNPQTTTVYNDYNLTFHPYKFDLSDVNASVGLNNDAITATSYIYMADMNKTQEMSYHLIGDIFARGYNDSNLSNFVSECYAKPVDINLTRTMADVNGTAYQYRFNSLDSSDAIVSTASGDLNNTAGPIQLSEGNFTQPLNGYINSKLNLNFFRENNNSINPRRVEFNTYSIDCTNAAADCTFNADLTSKTTHGETNLDHNVSHYYGKTNSPRSRFQDSIGQQAFIFYEVYCEGSGCDKSLLQDDVNSAYTNDPRWFVNTNHNSGYGIPGRVNQKGFSVGNGFVYENTADASDLSGNHPDHVRLDYNGNKGYPYKTTMENNASNWLIYNKYDATDTKNEFEVEFEGTGGDWVGEHETNTTTIKGGTSKVNRRSMW